MTEQEAIKAGIRHWEENKKRGSSNASIGPGTCELCELYHDHNHGNKCVCPLTEKRNKKTCCKEWRACFDAIIDVGAVPDVTWECVCDAMINRLKSLLK